MPKIKPYPSDRPTGWIFQCPGCRNTHVVYERPNQAPGTGASWILDGDWDTPTFTPSINSRIDFHPSAKRSPVICHFYITNGQFQFLSDCTHQLAGQTVPMLEMSE